MLLVDFLEISEYKRMEKMQPPAGYMPLPEDGAFRAKLRATGMDADECAEDLRIQGIKTTDVSNVRRWMRGETNPPGAVCDRLTAVAAYVDSPAYFGNEAIDMPPAAQRLRHAIQLGRRRIEADGNFRRNMERLLAADPRSARALREFCRARPRSPGDAESDEMGVVEKKEYDRAEALAVILNKHQKIEKILTELKDWCDLNP